MARLKFRKYEKASDTTDEFPSATQLEVSYWGSESKVRAELDLTVLEDALRKTDIEYVPTEPLLPTFLDALEGASVIAGPENEPNLSRELKIILDAFADHGLDVRLLVDGESDGLLEIESNLDFIYELPWEALSTGRPMNIRRKLYGSARNPNSSSNDNYAFLVSHGYLDSSDHYAKIVDDFEEEVLSAVKNIFAMRKGEIKPQLLTVLRYLSLNTIKSIDLGSYSSLHLLLHGRMNGDIGFENPINHWQIEWLTPEAFIELLKPHKYDLIFLSCCYSGYGDIRRSSLAQQLVKANIANSVVAFSGPIGSKKTLPPFVKNFYDRYSINKNVEDAFHGAVDFLRREANPYSNKPILYLGGHI